jgi:hypothetical protein
LPTINGLGDESFGLRQRSSSALALALSALQALRTFGTDEPTLATDAIELIEMARALDLLAGMQQGLDADCPGVDFEIAAAERPRTCRCACCNRS